MKIYQLIKVLATFVLLAALQAAGLAQGVTTSSMNGQVTDENGEPLIGANVVAIHQPTGTQYGNATNEKGIFRIPYMRVGGPYKIVVSYTGYERFEKEDVYLSLGQAFNLGAELSATSVELEGIEVTASSTEIIDGNRDGQKTVVDERTINDVPTISRSIQDFARLNPLASISEGSDGFSLSLAGQNNRYNTIYFDGAVSNDVFGLAGSGTNGGQTGAQPISLDAIEQFTISVAPFDIRQSGFAGGTINAVTRSGSNEFEGSAYYFLRNESFAGKTPGGDIADEDRTRLSDFSAETYGLRLGGPIIKNKLFFFANGEIVRNETPQPFEFDRYRGNSTLDEVNQLSSFLQENFGYNPGVFLNNTATLDVDKFLGKIDWNISEKHKLSVRHNYVKAENLEARNSNAFGLEFINGSEFFVSEKNSTALEVNSVFNNNISNKLIVNATFVRDDRDPFGANFPTVELEDGESGEIVFGAERFSTANRLDQDVITARNDFTIYKGRHSALFGVNFEYFNAANLFIRNNFGRYIYDDSDGQTGVQKFLAGDPATEFERSFSQVDNIAGDGSAAIAEFEQILLGFYLQDEFQVNQNLKLTGGLRFNIPFWPTDQPLNQSFNEETVSEIQRFGYDLQGAQTGQFIESQILFSPRFSFNWDISGRDATQLRGGIGMFTSRIPLVWPGGAYNNYGFNIGEVEANNVPFDPNVQNQPVGFDENGNPIRQIDPNNITPSGQIDLFAEDFRLPQTLRVNLALDQKLPGGIIGTLEGIFTKYQNNVRYQNFQLKPAQRLLEGNGPDNRPLFNGVSPGFGDDVVDDRYTGIFLASNTDKGYSFNAAVSLKKPFSNGFAAQVSYAYSDSYTLFDLTSSQNNSQWRGFHNVRGKNFEREAQRSDFAIGHRVFGQVSYAVDYLDFGTSKLSLNFNGQTGGFFSYVVDASNFRFVDDGAFSDNELIFVPESPDQINLVEKEVNGVTYSPAAQWTILDNYIENHDDLADRRGQYATRNSGREPFEFTMDLRFLQDFYLEMANGKRNILQFSVDIFNFTNLLNREWGIRRRAGSFGNYGILELENSIGFPPGDNNTAEYTINQDLIENQEPWDGNIDDSGLRSSRWQMQIGVRYIFN